MKEAFKKYETLFTALLFALPSSGSHVLQILLPRLMCKCILNEFLISIRFDFFLTDNVYVSSYKEENNMLI